MDNPMTLKKCLSPWATFLSPPDFVWLWFSEIISLNGDHNILSAYTYISWYQSTLYQWSNQNVHTLTARMVPVLICLTFSTTPYAPLPKMQILSRSSASIFTLFPSILIVVSLSNGLPSTRGLGGLLVFDLDKYIYYSLSYYNQTLNILSESEKLIRYLPGLGCSWG